MTRLLLVRHGQSTWNRERRLQGQSMEPELTLLGQEQAIVAAVRVARVVGEGTVAVWSSDQTRARQTADVVAARLGVEIHDDIRLREQALGTLEGRPIADLVALPVPEDSHISEIAWAPGAETIADVHSRLTTLIADLRAHPPADTVVLVSHGDTLRVLLGVLAGQGHREVEWVPVPNGAVLEHTLS